MKPREGTVKCEGCPFLYGHIAKQVRNPLGMEIEFGCGLAFTVTKENKDVVSHDCELEMIQLTMNGIAKKIIFMPDGRITN